MLKTTKPTDQMIKRRLPHVHSPVCLRTLCVCAVFSVILGACSTSPATPAIAPAGTLVPRAYVPAFNAGGSASNATPQAQSAPADAPATPTEAPIAGKRVLFIQGDHTPESGYPHSRVSDDGSKPESFTRLRHEVLEGDLKLGVDELVLSKATIFNAATLKPYALVVLGSNARALGKAEVSVLTSYLAQGGSVLTYADSQYGPNNWASDNSFLGQFGIQVLTDNFQPAVDITDVVSTHPIMAGVKAIRGEGLSQFVIHAANKAARANQVLAQCSPPTRSGCALAPAEQAQVKAGDSVVCVVVRENAAGGRLAGVCDRNWFQNGPGPGSDLDQADDRLFARNLFRWLSKQ
jgi:hypothetical protein